MEEYVTEFEKLYTKAKKFKLDLPEPVLAFKLLDCSGLNHKDHQLTLTGVNYAESGTLFKQMSVSLKKFFRKQAITSADNCYSGVSVKVEPVFSSKEVYYSRGYGRSRAWQGGCGANQTNSRGRANIGRISRQRNQLDLKEIQQSV